MEPERKKDLEEELYRIFTLVNDWLKFAETKNGALFALSGAGIAAILGFFASKDGVAFHWKAGLIATGMCLCVSAVFAILSFLPSLTFVTRPTGEPTEEDNLIFFGHLAKYVGKEQELVQRVATWYILNEEESKDFSPSRLHLHLAHQIINNAQLSLRKFQWAQRSVWAIVVAGVVAIVVPFFILLVKHI